MELGFFTMPMHPVGKDWRVSLREDREAFVLADELGFVEGYAGEHATDRAENITSCTMFLASLVGRVKRMRLGTGTVNLPNSHPATVAARSPCSITCWMGASISASAPAGCYPTPRCSAIWITTATRCSWRRSIT